jgi:uncharacterized protein
MNTPSIDQTLSHRLHLQFDDAPAFGSGAMPAAQDRTFTLLAILFPLIVWPWKRSASPAVDAQGKESLNMALTLMLVLFPLGIVTGIIGSPTFAMLVSLVTSLVSLALLGLVVLAAVKSGQGKLLRYPGNLRLIK